MLDFGIVVIYFVLIFLVAIRGRIKQSVSVDAYFLGNRSLKWPSIAFSTIATNIQGYQFLGMMGSAYLYGLAQASLEINAIQGILLAAFLFVPLYLKERVVTITQFIEKRAGKVIARLYSLANIGLFSTITLGAALFWGAYAAELVFTDYLSVLHSDRLIRIAILLVGLGVFSAVYTYLGGLNAVVKTDVIQFVILLGGGMIITWVVVRELGGWGKLYDTPELMHLHLPADHPTLPWTHILGLFFLNINYWCANQTIIQRSLAAQNLGEAQKGLIVGGILKYLMAVIIVIPGIALVGILGENNSLQEPDQVFPYLVQNYLPIGVQGLVLCALFASLMSTVDSTFNSIATLWSVDIYKGWIKSEATDEQMVSQGRRAILFTLFSGILMGMILLYLKFDNPESAFTHTLNELRYYINCGIVVLICTIVLMMVPNRKATLIAFLCTVPLNILIKYFMPEMNYFVRAFWVIILPLTGVILFSLKGGWLSKERWERPPRDVTIQGIVLAISLVLVHIIFH